jgi:glycerate dehydrogenase
MQAAFLDYDPVSYGDLDQRRLFESLPDLRLYAFTAVGDVAQRIAALEIVLLNATLVSREALAQAPRLRLIAIGATGTDNVDVRAAEEFGIAVCNVGDYCTPSLTQHVWAMILALTQRLAAYGRFTMEGHWASGAPVNVVEHSVRELRGRTLGIVGWGALGSAVAAIAPAFGMNVLVSNRVGAAPAAGRVALPELLRSADVVSLHCPLNATTRGLIGAAELALMKPDALLINTARGGLVDAPALAAALRAGRLAGAGIDVLDTEPPVHGDPLLDASIPNLIVTPHVAYAARESRQRCLDELAANVESFLRGQRRARIV